MEFKNYEEEDVMETVSACDLNSSDHNVPMEVDRNEEEFEPMPQVENVRRSRKLEFWLRKKIKNLGGWLKSSQKDFFKRVSILNLFLNKFLTRNNTSSILKKNGFC